MSCMRNAKAEKAIKGGRSMSFKKIAAVLMAAALCSLIFAGPAYAEKDVQAETNKLEETIQSGEASAKNETVYAQLNSNGSVSNIYVVNQLIGEYTDYGNYTSVKNLSTKTEPVIEGDKITFIDGQVDGGLYYQGAMEGELPMTFDIQYFLDGETVDAKALAGASGHLKIEIGCAQNESCDVRIREGLTAQVMLSIDLNLAQNVKADDATTVITGNTMSVNYTVLPGESGEFVAEADVADFEMDAISITMMQANLNSYTDSIDEYEEGFDDMASGADDMVDGTTELKDGISALADGMDGLSDGLNKLKTSGGKMLDGMRQYGAGLQAYSQGASDMASASENIKAGLDTLAGNGDALAESLSQISGSVSAMSSNTELYALAQSLLSSSDPSVQALAQSTLNMLDGLGGVSAGISGVSDGLNTYTAGVRQASAGYGDFNAGLSRLASGNGALASGFCDITDGFEVYVSGVGKSASGASKISKAVSGLPDDIQELIDGQTEFRDGIQTAKHELLEETGKLSASVPVSFASPDKNHPDSVQYVFLTPVISKTEEKQEAREAGEEEIFISRFSDLFK